MESQKITRFIAPLPIVEFILLMALMMSTVALSIDSMLPALAIMGAHFNVTDSNQFQYIVLIFFTGLSFGQVFFGFLSDAIGRKKAAYMGMSLFLVGCFVAVSASTYSVLLFGRFLQGFGVSSGRVSAVAIVRDQYSGREMARILSFIMTIFILVPALAPSLGQLILIFFSWKWIFLFLMIIAVVSIIWLGKRQPETLPPEKRIPFSFKSLGYAVKEIVLNPAVVGYTLCSGFTFGCVVSYISTAQQIFQGLYHQGALFPVYFGSLAIFIGVASILNARIVIHFGMLYLVKKTLILFTITSILFYILVYFYKPTPPPFVLLLLALGLSFFCMGFLFGNLNALSIEPLGHIAGTATAITGFFQTLISVLIGGWMSQSFNGTLGPMFFGFMMMGVFALIIIYSLDYLRDKKTAVFN